MRKFILPFLVIGLAVAEDKEFVVTCPMIAICKASDGAKQNKAFVKINQEAYDCYRDVGETDLAESAAIATTKCLAIYGSTTATTMTNNSKSK